MKNLEAETTAHGMWWDGQYGGISKDGQFVMLYTKPNLPTLDKFDTMSCFPGVGDRDQYCYTVYHGVRAPLSEAHIAYVGGIIDSVFPDAGGGGGGGITNMRISESDRAVLFTTETGAAGKLPFADLKATPMEFYLDINKPSAPVHLPAPTEGVEFVVPIGAISMSGRHHHLTVDRAKNRVLVPEGGLRGTFRAYGAYRFSPSVKSAMDLDLTWYYRRLGSDENWTAIYTGNAKRTETQTTAALSWPTSSTFYDLPNYPVELEVRIRFNDLGDGKGEDVNWGAVPIFGDAADGLKISLYKNPNFTYVT